MLQLISQVYLIIYNSFAPLSSIVSLRFRYDVGQIPYVYKVV